jgi:hypothetical protein
MTAIAYPGLVWCGIAPAAFAMIYGVTAYFKFAGVPEGFGSCA